MNASTARAICSACLIAAGSAEIHSMPFREVKRLLPKNPIFATLRPTMKTFQNKTVVITGGTSGIGKATALAFAREGANVVVSGRRIAEGEQVVREITSNGGSALFVQTTSPGRMTSSHSSKRPSAPSALCTLPSTTPAPRAGSARSQPSRRSSTTIRCATSTSAACCCR